MHIVIVGTGNVAWHLAAGLSKNFQITVMARSAQPLQEFEHNLGVQTVSPIKPIDADLFILAVSDSAISSVAQSLKNKPLAHTAAAVPMDVLSFFTENYGVLYPFQTFRKQHPIDWQKVPIFVEACCPQMETLLRTVAKALSNETHYLSSDKRLVLHVAGVFANNFVNHLLSQAKRLMEENGLDYNWLKPLIEKTFENALRFDPAKMQTGPAIRHDYATINRHLQLLSKDPTLQQLYQAITQSIIKNNERQI